MSDLDPMLDTELIIAPETGEQGPQGAIVIAAGATDPPMGTPVGTIVYRLI